ncbi:MAG: tetratricopeptide repeat protein, partial [Phycisphaerae bacterium]|nr:tetratricopeptide repeat protein [Phycisphaerae bacterium]
EALALDASCVHARVLLGKVYIEQGHYTLAATELEVARDIQPASPEVHYLLGIARERTQQLDLALASYRQALALDATYVDAILAIGEVLAEMEQPAEALAYVEESIPAAPNRPDIYELAGRLAMILCEYDKAERYCQSACDLDYQNPCYIEALARAQFFAGRYDRAAKSLQQLSTASSHKDRAWVYVMLSECLLTEGRAGEAYEASYRATELDPSSADTWSGLAKASLAVGDFFRAACAAKEAVRLNVSDLDIVMVLGYALLRSGQAREALAVLTDASAAHPEDVTLKCLLGRAYAALGQQDQARRCYVAALQAEPDNVVAQELLAQSPPLKSPLKSW